MAGKKDYETAEALAVDLVDDFTALEIAQGWGLEFKAATKMDEIGIPAMVRAVMAPRFNKVLDENYDTYTPVGSLQLVKTETMGAFVKLFCKCAGVTVPAGRPK